MYGRTFVEPVGDTVEDELGVSGERDLRHGGVWVALVVDVVAVHEHLQCRISTHLNSTQRALTDAGVNTSMSASK